MAKQGARLDLSQAVLESPGCLHNLPGLVPDGIFPEIVYFNDGLDYHSSLLKYVEDFGILTNIENDIIWLVFHLIQLLIEINKLNKAPILEEWNFLKELLSFQSLN